MNCGGLCLGLFTLQERQCCVVLGDFEMAASQRAVPYPIEDGDEVPSLLRGCGAGDCPGYPSQGPLRYRAGSRDRRGGISYKDRMNLFQIRTERYQICPEESLVALDLLSGPKEMWRSYHERWWCRSSKLSWNKNECSDLRTSLHFHQKTIQVPSAPTNRRMFSVPSLLCLRPNGSLSKISNFSLIGPISTRETGMGGLSVLGSVWSSEKMLVLARPTMRW